MKSSASCLLDTEDSPLPGLINRLECKAHSHVAKIVKDRRRFTSSAPHCFMQQCLITDAPLPQTTAVKNTLQIQKFFPSVGDGEQVGKSKVFVFVSVSSETNAFG